MSRPLSTEQQWEGRNSKDCQAAELFGGRKRQEKLSLALDLRTWRIFRGGTSGKKEEGRSLEGSAYASAIARTRSEHEKQWVKGVTVLNRSDRGRLSSAGFLVEEMSTRTGGGT